MELKFEAKLTKISSVSTFRKEKGVRLIPQTIDYGLSKYMEESPSKKSFTTSSELNITIRLFSIRE
jgi:hypothetical protein